MRKTTTAGGTTSRFYHHHHDQIFAKRYNSPFWLRRYAHRAIYDGFLPHIEAGLHVLDSGCGEGVLSILMGRGGAKVTAADISWPNVKVAYRVAELEELPIELLIANAEQLPFADNSFDVVVSSHVLEHLPDVTKGLMELHRVARGLVLIAMPTCFNPAAWALLGGDSYWKVTRRSLFATPLGLFRTLLALFGRQEGPNEGYAGRGELPHIWRFPWVMRRQIESVGLRVIRWEAGPLIVPYLAEYLPIFRRFQPWLDQWGTKPIVRYLGYGSLVICEKS